MHQRCEILDTGYHTVIVDNMNLTEHHINELKSLAKKLGIKIEFESDLFTNPALIKQIDKDINEVQKNLASFEKIRKFNLIQTPFTIEGGELTPTLKVKRKFVEDKYKYIIDNMYHKV